MAEQLRVDAEYERGVDGLARAADLGRVLVQRVEVLQDVVERAFGYVFPFILSGVREREMRDERRGKGGVGLTIRRTSVYWACMRAVTLVSS